jgi:hypothetical protein
VPGERLFHEILSNHHDNVDECRARRAMVLEIRDDNATAWVTSAGEKFQVANLRRLPLRAGQYVYVDRGREATA